MAAQFVTLVGCGSNQTPLADSSNVVGPSATETTVATETTAAVDIDKNTFDKLVSSSESASEDEHPRNVLILL